MLMRRNVAAGIGSNEQGEYCGAALQRSDRKEPRYKWPTLQQRRRVSARPQSPHWLPVQQRIQYKIAVITHKALSTSVPPYIDELLQQQVTTRSLRSTDAPRLSVPCTSTETAKRAFCVAAPNVWNSLLNDITPVHCQPSVTN